MKLNRWIISSTDAYLYLTRFNMTAIHQHLRWQRTKKPVIFQGSTFDFLSVTCAYNTYETKLHVVKLFLYTL